MYNIYLGGDHILKYLILTTHDLVGIAIYIGIFICLLSYEKIKFTKIGLFLSIILGSIIGFIQFIIRLLYPKRMNVEMIHMNRVLAVIAGIFIVITFIISIIDIFKQNKVIIIVRDILTNLSIVFILGKLLPDIFKYVTEFVYFGEETISTQSLLRFVGYLIGIFVCILIAISTRKLFGIGGYGLTKTFYITVTLVFAVLLGTGGYADMVRLKWFRLKRIFSVNVFASEFINVSIYILISLLIMFSIYIIVKNWKLVGEFPNNALRRKKKAGLRRNRRWAKFTIFISAFAVFTLTYLNYIDTKPVELSPPESYQEEGENIIIPLNTVDDGHLHRFILKGKQGHDIRFLVVKKPQGSAYGLGLDACEICGVAGYFERDDQVVCKRCDVVMNKATIGFKGGCNPIPFDYEIKDGKIIIKKSVLYEKEDVFS